MIQRPAPGQNNHSTSPRFWVGFPHHGLGWTDVPAHRVEKPFTESSSYRLDHDLGGGGSPDRIPRLYGFCFPNRNRPAVGQSRWSRKGPDSSSVVTHATARSHGGTPESAAGEAPVVERMTCVEWEFFVRFLSWAGKTHTHTLTLFVTEPVWTRC